MEQRQQCQFCDGSGIDHCEECGSVFNGIDPELPPELQGLTIIHAWELGFTTKDNENKKTES